MPPKSLMKFECPRCGYTTNWKSSIRYHLYDIVKPCKAIKLDIILTDIIKEQIRYTK